MYLARITMAIRIAARTTSERTVLAVLPAPDARLVGRVASGPWAQLRRVDTIRRVTVVVSPKATRIEPSFVTANWRRVDLPLSASSSSCPVTPTIQPGRPGVQYIFPALLRR